MTNGDGLTALRAAFDRSFMEAPRPPDTGGAHLLTFRAADRRYALRLEETAGVFADRPITALPGPRPELLGVATFRGQVTPVYDLAALLGHQAGTPGRWLVLVAGSPTLAVAFDELDGHVLVPAEALSRYPAGAGRRGLSGMVQLDEQALGIVDLAAVRATIHANSGHGEESTSR